MLTMKARPARSAMARLGSLLAATAWLAFAASPTLSASDVGAPLTSAKAKALLDERLGGLGTPDGPGCVSAIARDGQVLATRAKGLANLELKVALTPDSVFDIGSTSKQFTAASIAILSRRGKIDLDADIRTYLPELKVLPKPVTVRQLIHHSGGYPDPYEALERLYGDHDGNLYPSDATLKMAAGTTRTEFEPGEKYAYSNVGYLLLGQIVERVSGQSLRAFAEANIFAPLGMSHTHFHDNYQELTPNRASAYGRDADGKTWIWRHSDFTIMGDGGVFSTDGDLAKWYDNFSHPRLEGGQALVDLLLTPGVYRSGPATYRGHPVEYGFGVMIDRSSGAAIIGHPGSWAGYGSIPYFAPAHGLGVIVLCNSTDDRSGLDKVSSLIGDLAAGRD